MQDGTPVVTVVSAAKPPVATDAKTDETPQAESATAAAPEETSPAAATADAKPSEPPPAKATVDTATAPPTADSEPEARKELEQRIIEGSEPKPMSKKQQVNFVSFNFPVAVF